MTYVTGDTIIKEICRLHGLDPKAVRRITIDATPHNVAVMHIDYYTAAESVELIGTLSEKLIVREMSFWERVADRLADFAAMVRFKYWRKLQGRHR